VTKRRSVARIGAAAAVVAAIAAGAGTAHAVSLPDADAVVQDDARLPSLPSVDPAELSDALKSAAGRPRKLRRRSPGWFGRAEERRLRGRRSKTQAPADAPLPGQAGIRPGSMMVSPFICTMNFIFTKGDTLAIGTAGHCLEGGERVVLLTLAPTGGDPVLVELGKTLLRRDGGIGHDYGLVRIPASRHEWVFPTIAGVGGPCGAYDGGDPQPLAHYGHGLVGGTGGTPRAGIGVESDVPRGFDFEWDRDSYSWVGELSNGDSGSPVRIAQLGAVGNLTHGLGVDLPVPQPSVLGWGTRITTITERGWTLVDSPLCPP
jgi:hypothetical protein